MSDLPAVMSTPALPALYEQADTNDIQLPNIFLQGGNSQGVVNGITSPGDVILALGASDTDPIFLITKDKPSFEAYVIGRKKFAATTADNRLTFHRDNKRDPDDPKSWEGYFFLLSLPDVDPDIPARVMIWKTSGRQAAKKLNYFIEKAMMASRNSDTGFVPPRVKFSLQQRSSQDGIPYKAWEVNLIQADDNLDLAMNMMSFGQYLADENAAPDMGRPSENEAPSL